LGWSGAGFGSSQFVWRNSASALARRCLCLMASILWRGRGSRGKPALSQKLLITRQSRLFSAEPPIVRVDTIARLEFRDRGPLLVAVGADRRPARGVGVDCLGRSVINQMRRSQYMRPTYRLQFPPQGRRTPSCLCGRLLRSVRQPLMVEFDQVYRDPAPEIITEIRRRFFLAAAFFANRR
jgi:hypothetical protein